MSVITAARSFRGDRRGTSTILFAFCLVPAIGCIGLGVDYTTALARKARLDAATDAAAISAITAAKAYVSANSGSETDPGLTNDAIAAGKAQGAKTFALDAASELVRVSTTPNVNLTRSGQTFTATVSYAGQAATTFGGIFGVKTFNIGGTATSSVTIGSYLDFYLALDVSGSMGLPTSTTGQTQLQGHNNGCQFACHYAGQDAGYKAARANKITLRVDSVGTAVTHLVQTAQQTATLQNQYRIGAYTFVNDVTQAAQLSSTFTTVAAVGASLGDNYLDAGLSTSVSQSMGSGGTHFENLFSDMNQYVKSFGSGASAASPRPFLFIVTDGMDNNQTYTSNNGFNGSQPKEPNNFGYCQYAQQLGVTVSILYIPYQQIVNPTAAESQTVNAVIPKIPADLQACASSGFFFTANSDADIDSALQAMFNQALKAARLTK